MIYERLTKCCEDNILHVFDINDHEIALSELKPLDIVMLVGHLTNLEDKIESGDLVDRNDYLDHLLSARSIFELTDKEIEFFVKHNARVRGFMTDELARLTAENQRLKEEAAEQKSIAAHEHALQMEWFRRACDRTAELINLRRSIKTNVEPPHRKNKG